MRAAGVARDVARPQQTMVGQIAGSCVVHAIVHGPRCGGLVAIVGFAQATCTHAH
jgi:hypothetical protein